MEMVVYADILFFLNFIIDLLLLTLTSVILRLNLNFWRLSTGAATGALFAVFMFYPEFSKLYSILGKFIFTSIWISIIMKAKSFKKIINSIIVFFCVSFLFCGTIFLMLFTFSKGSSMGAMISNGVFYADINFSTLVTSLVLSFGIVYILKTVFVRNFSRDKIIIKIGIESGEKIAYLNALIDTGCELKDVLTDSPVIIVEFSAIKHLAITETYILPFESVDGARNEIQVFKADRIVAEDERFKINDKTVIGVTNKKLSYDGLYRGIINPDAIYEKGGKRDEVSKGFFKKDKRLYKAIEYR